jgi:hypothetical protein
MSTTTRPWRSRPGCRCRAAGRWRGPAASRLRAGKARACVLGRGVNGRLVVVRSANPALESGAGPATAPRSADRRAHLGASNGMRGCATPARGRRAAAWAGGLRLPACRRAAPPARLDGAPHRLVHLAAVAEAHLDLGRVHVDVDARRLDLQVQRVHRLAVAVQQVLVGAAGGVRDHLVAHVAAVDVGELPVGARARRIRDAGAAGDAHRAHHRGSTATLCARKSSPSTSARRWSRVPGRHCSTSLPSCQTVKPTSGRASAWRRTASMQCASSVASVLRNLRRAGVLKNSSLTSTVVPVARAAGRSSPLRHRAGRRWPGRGAREQVQLGHRGDGRQRLAAKAHGGHRFQVGSAADLAGGVAPQRDRQFLARDAGAVVLDRDQPHAAGQQAHRDLGGAGVQRVVDQFAHHRRGALHHLAGGDLADQLVGQVADGAAMARMEHGIHGPF